MSITLTQEKDPFFLFTNTLCESDFLLIKSSQGLLVDFNVFPDKLIELFESIGHAISAQLVLETGRGSLDIVESNTFRQIIHISLLLKPATDDELRQHLADLVAKSKEEVKNLKQQVELLSSSAESRMHENESTVRSLRIQIDALRLENSENVRNCSGKLLDELKHERESHLRALDNEKIAYEREFSIQSQKYEENTRILTSKYQSAANKLESLKDQLQIAEDNLESVRATNSRLSADLANVSSELASVRTDKNLLDSENKRVKTELIRVKENLSETDTHDRSTRDMCHKMELELDREVSRRNALAIQCDNLKGQLSHAETSFEQASQEITKGNEIIQKLQSELKAVKSVIKAKTSLGSEQEKMIGERTLALSQIKVEVEALRQEKTKFEADLAAKTQQTIEYQNQVIALERSNEEKASMIDWLNQQLNLVMIDKPSSPAPKGEMQFKSKIANNLLHGSTSPFESRIQKPTIPAEPFVVYSKRNF